MDFSQSPLFFYPFFLVFNFASAVFSIYIYIVCVCVCVLRLNCKLGLCCSVYLSETQPASGYGTWRCLIAWVVTVDCSCQLQLSVGFGLSSSRRTCPEKSVCMGICALNLVLCGIGTVSVSG
jgi:hypothetical protein